MAEFLFHVTLTPDTEDGGFVVSVAELPEVCTEGDTEEEAKANTEEAILCALNTRLALGWELPGRVSGTRIPAKKPAHTPGFLVHFTPELTGAFAVA